MNSNIDFTPYLQASVGFDRLFDLLQNADKIAQNAGDWPRYDIVRAGPDSYSIRVAVPGFSSDDLSLSFEPNLLIVRGNKADRNDVEYLYRGLATRSFERKFELADYVEVAGAILADGLLTIELQRELPEAMKARQIPIGASPKPAPGEQRQSESRERAA
jgi:molecular chaperone IbpA